MKSKWLLAIIAALASAVALMFLWRQFTNPTVNLQPSAAIGEVLAEEISRLLSGGGSVVLISRQPPPEGPSADRERIESFLAAIERRASLKLAATDWLPRPPVGTMDSGAVAAEQLLAALERSPDANVFAVFAGIPPYSPALAQKITTRPAKLVAVCGYSAGVRRWLESKALSVAVVPRFDDPPANAPAPHSPREWFEREYLLITPESLGQLSY